MFPYDPPENIRKPKVFCCFQGDQKGTLGRKGLFAVFAINFEQISFLLVLFTTWKNFLFAGFSYIEIYLLDDY